MDKRKWATKENPCLHNYNGIKIVLLICIIQSIMSRVCTSYSGGISDIVRLKLRCGLPDKHG